MKIAKRSNFTGINDKTEQGQQQFEQYAINLDTDVRNLVALTNGRIRFGSVSNGARGENIAGEFRVFTTSATPDAENTIVHTVGSIPSGYIIVSQDKAGSLYLGTTAWTSTNIYLKANVASMAFKIFLIK